MKVVFGDAFDKLGRFRVGVDFSPELLLVLPIRATSTNVHKILFACRIVICWVNANIVVHIMIILSSRTLVKVRGKELQQNSFTATPKVITETMKVYLLGIEKQTTYPNHQIGYVGKGVLCGSVVPSLSVNDSIKLCNLFMKLGSHRRSCLYQFHSFFPRRVGINLISNMKKQINLLWLDVHVYEVLPDRWLLRLNQNRIAAK
jgi:hypothetical protein